MKNILVGGAWPYANNSLHVGHLAALLPGDVIARYHREIGNNVLYVSGTDSHGTPIGIRAKKEKVEPIEIVNRYHNEFSKNFKDLDFSYDNYSATMFDSHKEKVKEYFKIIQDNDYIFEQEIEQDFCPICNEYLSDREIIGVCPHCGKEAMGEQCDHCLNAIDPSSLTDKHCKICNSQTIVKKNKHLYFKLSAFQKVLEELVEKSNWRKNAINESLKYLKLGVIDRAATRHLNWGVEVPVSGYDDKRIYVWIEAVLGYLTAALEVAHKKGIDFESFLKDMTSYFAHGKDNIIFHTIIFPALLDAINKDYCKPTKIISCEYMNMNDEKMSKSKGNLITINELVSKYNKDTIRFYFLNNGPEKKDTNFSETDMINFHNKFLVGVIGNFINRNLSFINKKFDGVITEGTVDKNIILKTEEVFKKVSDLVNEGELRAASDLIIEYAVLGNKYYDEQQPWIKVKEDINEFNNITYTCVYMMANLASLLSPFIPTTSLKIKTMLNLGDSNFDICNLKGNIKINNLELLFDRIED